MRCWHRVPPVVMTPRSSCIGGRELHVGASRIARILEGACGDVSWASPRRRVRVGIIVAACSVDSSSSRSS
jgi:hypothetical protein